MVDDIGLVPLSRTSRAAGHNDGMHEAPWPRALCIAILTYFRKSWLVARGRAHDEGLGTPAQGIGLQQGGAQAASGRFHPTGDLRELVTDNPVQRPARQRARMQS